MASGGTTEVKKRTVRTQVKTVSHHEQSEVDKKTTHGDEPEKNTANDNSAKKLQKQDDKESLKGSFWLTRIVIIRYMGFLYFVAFLVSLHQNKQLLGKNGLLPANLHLSLIKERFGTVSPWSLMSSIPTVFWFVDYEQDLEYWFDAIALAGLAIASFMIVFGSGNWPLLLTEWLLYHSLVNVGQTWFGFGWESQILETGFLTVFLCPMLSLYPVPKNTPTSFIVIFGYRWIIFRIMIGAGLIKIRGDKCWRDLTCMMYHYETQPVPNPISYYMHQSPDFFHKLEVLSNHFVELLAPFLLLFTRSYCMLGGVVQILFQVVLIISGNLSFLNWLTILPSLACFDDASWAFMFSGAPGSVKAKVLSIVRERKEGRAAKPLLSGTIRKVFNISLAVLITYLSIPVVQNLLSNQQRMNTSFDPLRLVNTYGAFGSVTKKRTEVVFEGTTSTNPHDPGAVWEEYQFKCKPGDVYRRPCIISPYHYRLDWLMWFAAFQNYERNPWLVHLAVKLLANDEQTDTLMAFNPFKGKQPPKFVRAEHYRYTFTKLGSKEARLGAWWNRKKMGPYLQPVSLEMLKPVLKSMAWPEPVVNRPSSKHD